MQKARKATPPMPRAATAASELEDAPLVHRCPFCREGTHPDSSVVCRDCLTRHHGGCWEEGGGRCSSCQGTRRFEPETLTLGRAIALLESHGYDAEAIKAVLAPVQAPSAAPRRGVLRRAFDGVLALVLTVALPMLAALILFAGILDWPWPEVRVVFALTFAFSFLIGLLYCDAAVRKG